MKVDHFSQKCRFGGIFIALLAPKRKTLFTRVRKIQGRRGGGKSQANATGFIPQTRQIPQRARPTGPYRT